MSDNGYTYFWNDQGDADVLCDFCYNGEKYHARYPTDHGETDSPTHCSQCHRPQEHSLTDDGVQYVLEAVVNALLDWDISPIGDILPWYENTPNTEVVKDWAQNVMGNYFNTLDDHDQELIWYFLDNAPDTLLYS